MRRPLWLAAGAIAAVMLGSNSSGGNDTRAETTICATPASLLRLEPALTHIAERIGKLEALTIVAIGSSSTEGIGASTPAMSYPSRLEAELRQRFPEIAVRVVNRGKRGEDAQDGLARLERDVIAERPHLVIWQVGTNALLRRDDWTADRDAIHRGIERLRQTGSDVVLMDMQYAPRVIARPRYVDMQQNLAEIAARAGVGRFRRFEIMRYWHQDAAAHTAPAIGADGLHMTDRSYGCLAAGLAEAIADNWRRHDRESRHSPTGRIAKAAVPADPGDLDVP